MFNCRFYRTCLHGAVIGAAAAFGAHPGDILGGVFDVAGFAVHAVLRVDLQAVAVVFVFHELVHARRAVARLGTGVLAQVHRDRRRCILQRQVAGLVFVVVGAGQEYRAEAVEGQHAIGLRVVDLRLGRGRF